MCKFEFDFWRSSNAALNFFFVLLWVHASMQSTCLFFPQSFLYPLVSSSIPTSFISEVLMIAFVIFSRQSCMTQWTFSLLSNLICSNDTVFSLGKKRSQSVPFFQFNLQMPINQNICSVFSLTDLPYFSFNSSFLSFFFFWLWFLLSGVNGADELQLQLFSLVPQELFISSS